MKFLISVFLVISVYAKVIDTIAVLVNNIPITTYQISQTEKKLNSTKNQAISYLIDKAVLKSAIKQRGIYVDDFDIDNAMKNIAQRNGMSLFNFKNYLLQKGELSKLKAQLKLDIEKQKLIKTLNVIVTKKEVEDYYKAHKNKFILPGKIEVTKYSSTDKQLLAKVIKSPLLNHIKNVEIKDMTLDITKNSPKLINFLAKYKVNTFTPIVTINNKFTSFYIIKKDKATFQTLAGQIYEMLMIKAQNKALQDFLEKLKAKADIQILAK